MAKKGQPATPEREQPSHALHRSPAWSRKTLRNEGFQVRWTPPTEDKGLGEVLEAVAVVYIVRCVDTAVRAAVEKARQVLRRSNRPGKIDIDDDPERP